MADMRINKVLDFVRKKQYVSMRELCEAFPGFSEMTLRRDLNRLQEQGVLRRVWGGAEIIDEVIEDQFTYTARTVAALAEKQNLVRKALPLITPGCSVFLDSGSTIHELTKALPKDSSVYVVSCNPYIVTELDSLGNCEVLLTGGTVNKKMASLNGPLALASLEGVNIDMAFLSAAAVSATAGFTNTLQSETLVQRRAMESASVTIMLVDSTKMGKIMPYTICGFKDIDILVTDKPLPADIEEKARAEGVRIIA